MYYENDKEIYKKLRTLRFPGFQPNATTKSIGLPPYFKKIKEISFYYARIKEILVDQVLLNPTITKPAMQTFIIKNYPYHKKVPTALKNILIFEISYNREHYLNLESYAGEKERINVVFPLTDNKFDYYKIEYMVLTDKFKAYGKEDFYNEPIWFKQFLAGAVFTKFTNIRKRFRIRES